MGMDYGITKFDYHYQAWVSVRVNIGREIIPRDL